MKDHIHVHETLDLKFEKNFKHNQKILSLQIDTDLIYRLHLLMIYIGRDKTLYAL
jgi:hypothetical protein